MDLVTLGKTGITVNKNGFGALPIQRISKEESSVLLRRAYEAGIKFFDTALVDLLPIQQQRMLFWQSTTMCFPFGACREKRNLMSLFLI